MVKRGSDVAILMKQLEKHRKGERRLNFLRALTVWSLSEAKVETALRTEWAQELSCSELTWLEFLNFLLAHQPCCHLLQL